MIIETAADLAAGGDAVARAPDGRIVFVTGAAPSELVEVAIDEDNKTFLRAHVVRVVKPGATRVAPPCKYFGTCGGCSLQHVSVEEQAKSKQAAVLSTLARMGKVDLARVQVEPMWTARAEGSRSRARFAVGNGAIGFRAAKSRDVVDVERCLLLAPELQNALDELRASKPEDGEHEAIAAEELEDEHGKLLLASNVFAQANFEGNREMVAEVARLTEGELILELYSGSGNFTRVLAKKAKRVLALEVSKPACALARRVLPKHVDIRCAPVERTLEKLDIKPDAIVLDPPRAGASRAVIAAIARFAPKSVIYVSCDPATFSRDVALLAQGGLALDKLRVFDLYPHTAHVELIGRLQRKNA